ncbi:MAG: radical SAM protein [Candidatus Omnitrophota bacterium]|nr:radical SAM protein [Candidatus Omnitrophota bacterium]
MSQVFYKFEFDETNFESESRRFLGFSAHLKENAIKARFLKRFPPCLLNHEHPEASSDKCIEISSDSFLVSNNLYYGDSFRDINKLFIRSPFISNVCRKCRCFKAALCRGLMNKQFVDDKNALINKIGEDNYRAGKNDYENCAVVAGSLCSKKCSFCFDRYIPHHILRIMPFLTPAEIFHFLHYIPDHLSYVGNSYHCRSGEIAESPYFEEVMPLIIFFSKQIFWVTNGRGISRTVAEQLRGKDIIVAISVITLDGQREKCFAQNQSPEGVIETINLLRENKIEYNVGLIPLKSLVDSGDIFDTIDGLLENDPACSIRIQVPSSCRFFEDMVKDEVSVDYPQFKSDLMGRYPDVDIWFIDDLYKGGRKEGDGPRLLRSDLEGLKANLKRMFADGRKYLVLCPERTYDDLCGLNGENVKVSKVVSLLGYTRPCTGVLRVDDYIDCIKREKGFFDSIVLPKASFDVNFDDFSLINVNILWGLVKERTRAVLLM